MKNFRKVVFFLAVIFFSNPAQNSYAQTPEDYYNKKAQKMKACKGDLDCAARIKSQSGAKARKFLNGESAELEPAEGFSDVSDEKTAAMNKDIDDVEKDLKSARLYQLMLNVNAIINQEVPHRCGLLIKSIKKNRKMLFDLNDEFKGKATPDYQRRARELKDAIPLEIQKYKDCFTENLVDFPGVTAEGIYTYIEFKARLGELLVQFKGVDLDAYIAELERAMARGDEVGLLAHVQERVEVLSGGGGSQWRVVTRGYELHLADEVRTGPGARAHIKLSQNFRTGGLTEIHIGADSHFKIEKIIAGMKASKNSKSIFSLIRGKLRILVNALTFKGKMDVRSSSTVAKAPGVNSSIGVRAGNSMGVIRGTELGVSYDPKTGIADYHLDHGDAYVESGGRQVALKPRTSLTVSRGTFGIPRPLSQTQWDGIVADTGGGQSEGGGVSQTKPQMANTSNTDTVPDSDIVLAARARRNYAKSVASTMLMAMKELDKEALLNIIAEPMRSDFSKALEKTSMKEMSEQARGRPLSHSFRCSICNKKGDKCQVLADVQMEADPIGQLRAILFDIEKIDRDSEFLVSDAPPADDAMVKTFMARNPVCGEQ